MSEDEDEVKGDEGVAAEVTTGKGKGKALA